MIKIGEKNEFFKTSELAIEEKKNQILELKAQLTKIKESITSKLPIRLLVAFENHHLPCMSFYTDADISRTRIYYFPDIDIIKAKPGYNWNEENLYANEIDLSKFYKSGHETFDMKLPYGKNFADDAEYKPIINSAVSDVKNRIQSIIDKNATVDSWELVGKLLIATYYNL